MTNKESAQVSIVSDIEEAIAQLDQAKKSIACTANELLRPVDKFADHVKRMEWRQGRYIIDDPGLLRNTSNVSLLVMSHAHRALDHINKSVKRHLANAASLISTNSENGYAAKDALHTSVANTKLVYGALILLNEDSHRTLYFLQGIHDEVTRYISANESNNYLIDNAAEILAMTKQQISNVDEALNNLHSVREELEQLAIRLESIIDRVTKELLTDE